MALPYSDEFIPHHPRGCEALLESVDFDINALSPEQIAACRWIYHLDDSRTLAERLAGEMP